METYPTQSLSLDVGTDNEKGVKFYQRMGMKIQKLYMSPNNDEFALFETPLDK
jgi:ribosomal protein S18 acetylase RimI-like enzyme